MANRQLEEIKPESCMQTDGMAGERADLQAVFDAAQVGLLVIDESGKITRANRAAAQLVETEVGKMLGRSPGNGISCVHARATPGRCGHSKTCPKCPIRSTFLRVLHTAEEVREVEASRTLVISGQEKDFYFSLNATPLELDGKRNVLLAFAEITRRKHAEDSLRLSKQALEGTVSELEAFNRAMIGREMRIVEVKREVNRLCGELGRTPTYAEALTPDDTIESGKAATEFGAAEYAVPPRHSVTDNPVVERLELEKGRRAALSLMEDANRANERLREMSDRDPLTDLLNRRAFHDRFSQEWERASRYQQPVSCVLMDLDFFKRINDTHGHAAGDATLKVVADVLMNRCRPSDIVCRYGGEEFCVLLPETNETDASSWAERTRTAISQATLPAGDMTLQVTASLGVAERQSDTTGPESLVQLADEALAMAKQTGRNRVVEFASLHESMPEWSQAPWSGGPLDHAAAGDVMSAIVYCPHQRDTVRHVTDLFLQTRLSSAPVVDESGAVVGIVTEADLMRQTAFGEGWDNQIKDVMRADVVCYEEDTPVREVYDFLSRVSVPRLVVVDQGQPTGVISRAILLRWFRNWVSPDAEADWNDRRDDSDEERQRRKAGIIRTAAAVEQRAAQLRQTVTQEHDNFVPCVVAEATRLQILVNDLLALCQIQ